MKLTLSNKSYSAKFINIINSKDRYVIAFGSRGSGKTHHIMLKLLLLSFLDEYNHILYVNKEFRHIKSQQYADFKKLATMYGIRDYFNFYDGDYRIVNNLTGTRFTPIGMDDPEKTKGISDPTIIWWDEITKGKLEDFLTLNALLRTPLNKNLQFIISFNPVHEKHWIRDYFFSKNDAYKLKYDFEINTLLHHSTYLDNDFINKDEYRKTLELNALGNVNRLLVDIEGRWGVNSNTNPFFYSYNTEKHFTLDSYKVDNRFNLTIGFDFNANPTSATIGQLNRETLSFHIIDVIIEDENNIFKTSPLSAVCKRIKIKYIDSGIINAYRIQVTGDASGRSGSADREKSMTFYSTIAKELKIHEQQIHIRNSNITHILSSEIINSALFLLQKNTLLFHDVPDLENEIIQSFADEAKSLNEAKKKYGLHILDSWRYLMDFWFANNNNNWSNSISEITNRIVSLNNRIKNNARQIN